MRAGLMGPEDVERRLPAWCALSELFLDTELQPHDFDALGRELAATGLPLPELRRILHDEVAPAFAPNLLSVAGEWAGWSPDDVREIVLRSLRRPKLLRWLGGWQAVRMVAPDWAELERRLVKLASPSPPPHPEAP